MKEAAAVQGEVSQEKERVLRKQPKAGADQAEKKRQQQKHMKEGWDLLCWPRFIKETTHGCVCMTLLY